MTDESIDVIERRADSLIENHERLLADLVRHRKKHNLTQATVAERMGVSQPTVSEFERYDANPTLSTIRRYALAVGVRLVDRVVDDCCASLGPDGLAAIVRGEYLAAPRGVGPAPIVVNSWGSSPERALVRA